MPLKRSARAPWSKAMIRSQLEVVDQLRPPSLVLTNATYLNVYVKQWKQANIWIENDRIVYVGPDVPKSAVETVDMTGKYVVPGYIEPHAHPFQLYNPATLSKYAGERGTTTLVNDNMLLFYKTRSKRLRNSRRFNSSLRARIGGLGSIHRPSSTVTASSSTQSASMLGSIILTSLWPEN
ncbi:putative adenine deaminase YerA domain protein [Exiguobacterium sp. S17]|nr:putative adenine deaminase YerA domain protein [Exiguobacterium sp. S17]